MRYYLMDLERTIPGGVATYWKPGSRGYTMDMNEAGVYSEIEAMRIVDNDFDNLTVKISEGIVKKVMAK